MTPARLAEIAHHVERNGHVTRDMAEEVLKHLAAQAAHHERLRHTGGLLASAAVFLAEHPHKALDAATRISLIEAQREWDAAIAALREWEGS